MPRSPHKAGRWERYPYLLLSHCGNINESEVKIIKEISYKGIEKLLEDGVIRNTRRGYVDSDGEHIGYYRTSGVSKKRYIEDYYADLVTK